MADLGGLAAEAALLVALAAGIGLALAAATAAVRESEDSPVDRIDALLPQSQCGQCGFPGCRPYAEAIAAGAAGIDRCAPGGDATVTELANLLGQPVTTVDSAYGTPGPPQVARIDEASCIGCALCLDACPVDAIVGAHGFLHTVIDAECTGCELCVAPCPVDCIALAPLAARPRLAA